MPYADPARRLEARRQWYAKHLRKGSGYQSSSKYDAIFDRAMENPGAQIGVAKLANQNSASVLAWRIKRNFYRTGQWEAWTRGPKVFARYLGDDVA